VVPNSGRGGVDAAELFGQREGALGLNVFGEEAAGQLLRGGPRTSLTGGRQNGPPRRFKACWMAGSARDGPARQNVR
jgi:hypothetical protein